MVAGQIMQEKYQNPIFWHQDLIRILYDAATRTGEDSSPRVSVLFGAEVMNIHTGDAIIGADGARGVVRQTLMQEEDTSLESDIPTGIAVFCTIIPKALIVENDFATWFYNDLGVGACIWPVGEANDLALCIYTPDSSQDGTWTEEAEKKFTDVLGQCDVRLQRLAALAGAATCVQLKEPYTLESWASQSGRVLVLGEAAHPFPPGGFHPYSVALEDAAFIGKIFSHTRNRDRVPEFFYAFQEHRHVQFRNTSLPFLNAGFVREARCSRIRGIDMEYVQAMTLPEGEMQAQRDAGIRANYAAGRNGLEGNFEHMLDDYRTVFGYDAMDDADEWWINWGRFRDTGRTDGPINLSQALISSVTTCVENDGNAEEAEEKILLQQIHQLSNDLRLTWVQGGIRIRKTDIESKGFFDLQRTPAPLRALKEDNVLKLGARVNQMLMRCDEVGFSVQDAGRYFESTETTSREDGIITHNIPGSLLQVKHIDKIRLPTTRKWMLQDSERENEGSNALDCPRPRVQAALTNTPNGLNTRLSFSRQ
ncbi:hypothetical protein B0H13DRAFT_2270657 [Mycena leptocephala]|nr:hypothetical protein B0H13DRAFT_2270657 [Mycena leptocephala]